MKNAEDALRAMRLRAELAEANLELVRMQLARTLDAVRPLVTHSRVIIERDHRDYETELVMCRICKASWYEVRGGVFEHQEWCPGKGG